MDYFTRNYVAVKPSSAGLKSPWNNGDKRVAVLMSGGVDSAVATLLLSRGGFQVAGVTMRLFGGDDTAVKGAAEVCRAISAPHFSIDLRREFSDLVISPFRDAYRAGETPNPCSLCNESVKFGAAIDVLSRVWGDGFGIATGHYARIVMRNGEALLARAEHRQKDQSYFLAGIGRALLARLCFPLGGLQGKEETRKIAREAGLPAAEAEESMEICFTAKQDYREIVGFGKPGEVVDLTGRAVGRHSGLVNYTLGQRKGLGVATAEPLFVVGIDSQSNRLVVAPRGKAYRKTVTAGCLNILSAGGLPEGELFYGKIRSQGEPQPCRVVSQGVAGVTVEFAEPVFAPSPAQRLALYTQDGIVAAGAVISTSGPAEKMI